MSPAHRADPSEHYASSDQLRIGLYIHVDLPWFRHPFTVGSFRVTSEEQIRELRALKKPRFRYDPSRSHMLPDGMAPDAAPAAGADGAAGEIPEKAGSAQARAVEAGSAPSGSATGATATGATATGATVTSAAASSAAASSDDEANVGQQPDELDSASAGTAANARVRQLREQRASVARAEKSFVKAIGVMRRLDGQLLSHPAATLSEMDDMVEQMAAVFLERADVTLQVMGENCGGEAAYHHGLNVSILCLMLARGLKLDMEEAAVLGKAALLHDVGLGAVAPAILKKSPQQMTAVESAERARHVEYGVKTGRRIGLSASALSIIEQHHELADGSGYPRGLRQEQITPLARVLALVNCYENLCNPADWARAITPHEALAGIFAHRKGQFDSRVLQLLIRALGVYPPGSAVRLSDDSMAMVFSVNPHRPLRPWVLLYDAAVPREQAAMINLEDEPGLCISNAIRPALLPAAVRAKLCGRQRISYYFDAGAPANGFANAPADLT